MKLIQIVHELRSASGTNAKIKTLEKHRHNDQWLDFLIATLDQRVTYGVSAPTSTNFEEVDITDNMFKCLDKLANREVTGNDAKILSKGLSEVYGEIPRLILGRSLKAGVSTKTINKVYPDLIPVFESMKGRDVEIKEFPVLSSIKFDGVKVFAMVLNNRVTLYSSSGTEFTLSSLINEFTTAISGVYEGELVDTKGKQENRTKISGKLNSLLAGTINDIEEYCYHIYDFIPLDEWSTKVSITPYNLRYKILISQFNTGFQDSSYVKIVKQIHHNNSKETTDFYNLLIQHGYEGSIHRYENDMYKWKRVDRLIKKKAIKECILECIDVIPHSNPVKGSIGSLVCSGIITDKEHGEVQVNVNVGSGLSKFDIMFPKERYVGSQIEVLYNSVTKVDNNYSLFLPRFKRILGDI